MSDAQPNRTEPTITPWSYAIGTTKVGKPDGTTEHYVFLELQTIVGPISLFGFPDFLEKMGNNLIDASAKVREMQVTGSLQVVKSMPEATVESFNKAINNIKRGQ